MNKKPIIGIAGDTCKPTNDSAFQNFNRHYCCDSFIKKLRIANAVPILLPFLQEYDDNDIFEYVNTIDGLLLPGGSDIEPSLYEEERILECGKSSIELDLFHIKLINQAIKLNKPILGICRGCQLINVALGGSLFQDIEINKNIISQHKNYKGYETATHSVNIKKDTKLKELIKIDQIGVNSLHHQSIKETGKSLIISALSEDGIIEAIEKENKNSFCLGIQWHPEAMIENSEEMNTLFKGFVDNCFTSL